MVKEQATLFATPTNKDVDTLYTETEQKEKKKKPAVKYVLRMKLNGKFVYKTKPDVRAFHSFDIADALVFANKKSATDALKKYQSWRNYEAIKKDV
jgi:hypothetical protein